MEIGRTELQRRDGQAPPHATNATVSSLNDGTEYDFRVRATNSVGNGPNSDEASATPETPFTSAAR